MGEYAKCGGKNIKIGTCEDMYYLRFDQRAMVRGVSGSVDPNGSAALAIRFRFPWPDEDHIQPGSFDNFDRAIPAYGFAMPDGVDHYSVQFVASVGYNVCLPCPEGTPDPRIHRNGFRGSVLLVRQKLLADGRVVPICMCGGCGALWRMEDPDDIQRLADCFRTEGQQRGWSKDFSDEIANRILTAAKMTPCLA